MTPAEEVGKCSECGSTDKGTRYSLTPQIMDALATFCKNPWHNQPEVHRDETQEFTELEFMFIIGACWSLTNRQIAEQCKISEEIIMTTMASVFDKTGISNRLELLVFVRDVLNGELRRRRHA